jgi:hypothetical protein
MPSTVDSYVQAIRSDGPVGWWRFSELLPGSAVAAGSQDPQNLALDASASGNLNAPINPNGNFLQYGSAVIGNSLSLLTTNGPTSSVSTGDAGGSALFPSTVTASLANIIAGGSAPAATGTYTITGAPTTGQNNGYTIGGTLVNSAQLTANTITQQAAADVVAINANTTVNKLVVASSAAGVVTITALAPGTLGNGITTTGTGNAGDTLTANQGSLAGGSGVASVISNQAILQPTSFLTVEAWHKPNVCATGSVKQVLACYGSDVASLAAWNLYHSGSSAVNHTFKFSVNVAGTIVTATATLPVVVVGSTYHVVGTYDGVNVRIYVNGVLQGTTAATGAISYASIAGYGIALGNDPSLTDANLQGYLDEVAIYAQALSATRIAYHYRQGSTYLPFSWNH